MPKVIFIFLVLFYFTLALFSGGTSYNSEIESAICLGFIILLGIPHGAIDNHLFLSKTKTSKLSFYTKYISLIGLNAIVWIILPQCSFIFFILFSAFHFGQSQFTHYFNGDFFLQRIIYISWGIAILCGLMFYNLEALSQIEGLQKAMAFIFVPSSEPYLKTIHLISSISFLILWVFLGLKKAINWEKIILEIIVFGLILITLYIFPPLVGFSLYFVILHSTKVMQEEYNFLIIKGNIDSFKEFIYILFPFTFISIIGICLMIGLIYFQLLNIPYGYLFLILISSITLPHVFVMDKFYN
jgi:Brp/Blh family beta-carotene 15,15'-monooxygenase